jgi:hypothetical protein
MCVEIFAVPPPQGWAPFTMSKASEVPNARRGLFAAFSFEKLRNQASRRTRRRRRDKAAFWLGPEHVRGGAV